MSYPRMSKALLFAAVLCGAQSSAAAAPHFAKVPADTPVYLGTTVDSEWIRDLGLGSQDALKSSLLQFRALAAAGADGAASEALLQAIADALLGADDGQRALIAQPGRLQFYVQGLNPVLRLSLRSGSAFETAMQLAAKKPGAGFAAIDVAGHRTWQVATDSTEWFAAVDGDDLLLATNLDKGGDDAVAALITGGAGFDPTVRLLPAMNRYDMSGALVSWFDLQQLQRNVVDPEHPVHLQIAESATSAVDKEQWQTFLSPDCQGDVSRFIKNTPHVVGAVEHSEQGDLRTLQSALVWPQTEPAARKAWQGLQGQVLDTQNSDAPLQLSLGFSGAGVPGFVQYVAADFAAMQCPIWREQAANTGLSLAMASSMSGMFSSVKGLSAQVFDFALDQQSNPDPASVDAQLSVLTDSPSLLLLMMRSMLSLPASIPEDGTPVTIDTPMGEPVQLAVYPHSINVYKGERATASVAAMAAAPKTTVSLFSYALDSLRVAMLFSDRMGGKTPQQLMQENDVDGLIPVFVGGSLQHLDYGMKLQSSAVYPLKKAAAGNQQITAAVQAGQ